MEEDHPGTTHTFFLNKNSVFEAQGGVLLFSCPFEAKIFLWLFLDYREKYALLFHPDRFYFIL